MGRNELLTTIFDGTVEEEQEEGRERFNLQGIVRYIEVSYEASSRCMEPAVKSGVTIRHSRTPFHDERKQSLSNGSYAKGRLTQDVTF